MNLRISKTSLPKRKRSYVHRPGTFVLTASFKDQRIDMTTVKLVAALIGHASQKQLAVAMDCGVSVIGKMVRIAAAEKMLPPECYAKPKEKP